MKTEADDQGFAARAISPSGDCFYSIGLSKREYFASAALTGLTANSNLDFGSNKQLAEVAVDLADKLIGALNEEQS